MERIGLLISKLQDQYQQQAAPSQMLVTLQMLQSELSALQNGSGASLGTAKVAVVMPGRVNVVLPDLPELTEEEKKYAPKVEEEIKLVIKEEAPVATAKAVQSNMFIDPVEIPTLSQHYHTPKNETASTNSSDAEELNDKLKESKTELGDVLKHEPIKDLRKAVGINDRFLFINELFRGDEAMYERSIKTINSFNIYPEAEYWINRELVVKLGWNTQADTVQHFYQLVKRRFS